MPTARLRLVYLLERPELCGGVKVILQHARLLAGLNYSVAIAGKGPNPTWWDHGVRYVDRELEPLTGHFDLVVATYWTTIRDALELDLGPVVHFCQGYEGTAPHLAEQVPTIESLYARELPTWVVSPHLGHFLNCRFGRRYRLAPPPLDLEFCAPSTRSAPSARPRVLISGIFQFELKGVETALRAVRLLEAEGIECTVVRLALLRLSSEERALRAPDEYHYRIQPKDVARLLSGCDLCLFPSQSGEGFGLPLLEAMAAGVPGIASDIPSVRFMTKGAVPLVRAGDVHAMANEALELLGDPAQWQAVRERGLRQSWRFHPRRVAKVVDRAVRWAARVAERPS